MKAVALTKAFKHGSTIIFVLQTNESEFKIMKKVINYVRGRNVESWRVLGPACTFESLIGCMAKFEGLVNAQRKRDGKEPVKFKIEE